MTASFDGATVNAPTLKVSWLSILGVQVPPESVDVQMPP
jgi:hypothetical protein